jgi:hypothetical protein
LFLLALSSSENAGFINYFFKSFFMNFQEISLPSPNSVLHGVYVDHGTGKTHSILDMFTHLSPDEGDTKLLRDRLSKEHSHKRRRKLGNQIVRKAQESAIIYGTRWCRENIALRLPSEKQVWYAPLPGRHLGKGHVLVARRAYVNALLYQTMAVVGRLCSGLDASPIAIGSARSKLELEQRLDSIGAARAQILRDYMRSDIRVDDFDPANSSVPVESFLENNGYCLLMGEGMERRIAKRNLLRFAAYHSEYEPVVGSIITIVEEKGLRKKDRIDLELKLAAAISTGRFEDAARLRDNREDFGPSISSLRN